MQAFNPSLLNLLTSFLQWVSTLVAITGSPSFLSTIPIPFAWSRSGYGTRQPERLRLLMMIQSLYLQLSIHHHTCRSHLLRK